MIRELRTVQVTCDGCGATQTFVRFADRDEELPDGWQQVYRDTFLNRGPYWSGLKDELCPRCVANWEGP
jgi:hypothetical protein